MTWKDVGQFVGKAAPVLGGLLGGKAGELAGDLLGKALGVETVPDKVLDALKNDPAAVVKVREIESNERVRLEEIRRAADSAESVEYTKQIQAVNATIQAEGQGAVGFNAFWRGFWRPLWGVISALAFGMVCVFICVLAYRAVMKNDNNALTMIPQFITSITLLFGIPGAILGIAAWHRGMMQREAAKDV